MYSGFGFDSEHSSFRGSQLIEIDTDFVGVNTLGILEYLNYGFTILRLMNCILENFGLFKYFWKQKFYLNLLEDFV